MTRRPHHLNIAAGLYCLATSPGFLPALCEKWSGFFYVHRVLLSYTRDRQLKVSSERLGNEDKAPCPRVLLPGWGSNRGPPVWKSEVLTAQPRQLLFKLINWILDVIWELASTMLKVYKRTRGLVNGGKFYERVGPLIDFQLTVYYICTVVWKKFTSNVLNICSIAS